MTTYGAKVTGFLAQRLLYLPTDSFGLVIHHEIDNETMISI
jgi:hypothetical protein